MAIIPDLDLRYVGTPEPDLVPRPAPRLYVVRVEVVQPARRTPLVAGQATLVRAYCAVDERLVRAGAVAAPASGERITATLVLRRDGEEIFRTGPTNPAGVPLGYHGVPLEFTLPGRYCRAGSVELVLDLTDGPTRLERAVFTDPRVPRIRIVPHPAVTPAELAATVLRAERIHPAPYLDYAILDSAPSALTPVFAALFEPDRQPIGLLPAAGPGTVRVGDGAGLARMIRNPPEQDLRRPRRYLALDARLGEDGRVDIRTAIPLRAPGRPLQRSGPAPLSVEVRDAAGAVLSTHHLDGPGAIDWDDRAAALVFGTGARLAVGQPPTARLAEPRVRAGVIHTAWISRHPREQPHVVAFYSADDGATWQPVGFSTGTEGSIDLATGSVPGGTRCRLRLIASAELASVDVVSAPFAVPLTPREVTIVALDPGQLAASAYSPDAGVCPPDELHWASDLDGDLGTGRQPAVPLRPGRHRITATAPDGTGGLATGTVKITVP
jgi:hypothetical protein